MNFIESAHLPRWKVPLLYCKCQTQQSSNQEIKKFCIETGCEEDCLFGENCSCSERHISMHPSSVFE